MPLPDLPLVEELSPAPGVMDALQAFAAWPGVVLFDSAMASPEIGRFSFLAADPWDFELVQDVAFGLDPFRRLRGLLPHQPPRKDLPPFQGGAAGLLGFGLGRALEHLPAPRVDEFQLPDLAVGLYDWVIAWDHAHSRAWIISQGFGPGQEQSARANRAARRLKQVQQTLGAARATWLPEMSADRLAAEQLWPQVPLQGQPEVTSSFTRDAYLRSVRRAIEYVHAGDIFQVNLSQRLLAPQRDSPVELYGRLRQQNPATFAGYFAWNDWAIASASPERFVSVRDGLVETRPIKGTRRRPPGPEADLFTRDELRESEKDQAENVMIVDLLRNDLSRVCQPGTIRVPELCRVEAYATVQHLVSVVRGQLSAGRSGWDLFAAAFPGGSVTGAPKVRAMQIIAELEPTARGPYCGSLFYLGHDGSLDSSILIRTFTVRKGWIQCPVGGGIVAQSHPAREYEETLHKAAGMLRAL